MGTTSLTPAERQTLADCERVVKRGLNTCYEVAIALRDIRDGRLYRGDFDSFETYCRERWNLTRQHCNRLIAASEVVANLEPTGSTPATERQSRPLAKLPPEEQSEAWQEAVAESGDEQPPASVVEAVVERRRAVAEPEDEAPEEDDAPPAGEILDLERQIKNHPEKTVVLRWLFDSCTSAQRALFTQLWADWWQETGT